MFDIVISGNRGINCDPYIVTRHLTLIIRNLQHNGIRKEEIRILTTCGSSAEAVAAKVARKEGITVIRKTAAFTEMGESAYAVRNSEIMHSDSFGMLMAFKLGNFGPDGNSDPETDDLIRMAYSRFGTQASVYGIPRVSVYMIPEIPGMDNFEEFLQEINAVQT